MESKFIEKIINGLAEFFIGDSRAYPVRKFDLLKIILDIKKNKAVTTEEKRLGGEAILGHLMNADIINSVPNIVYEKCKTEYFSVGLGASPEPIDPLLLLQAVDRKGVICFFSALEYYELTTQETPHHHIARIIKKPPESKPIIKRESSSRKNDPGKRDLLGSRQFSYNGIPFYQTKRYDRLVPGIKERYFNNALIRITTVEQTLIDTMEHPGKCGGVPVIFEAWENGLKEADITKLFEYLKIINDRNLAVRIGFMLDNFRAGDIPIEFSGYLEKAGKHMKNVIPLFKGMKEYKKINDKWKTGF